MPSSPVEPLSLDLGHLALFVGHAFSDAVLRELRQLGHPELRVSHGFVFQHLVEGDRTIGELAERLGVTQQAASKSVAELEDLGYLERTLDPDDRRVHRVTLSARGRSAIEASRRVRTNLTKKLAKRIGSTNLDAARATLAEVLELLGGADDVRSRRVRAPE